MLLDHGIYTELPQDTRLSYAKLWRGILSQDESMIRDASTELGSDFHQLFAAMIVNRKFEDIMDDSQKSQLRARLGDKQAENAQQEL